MQEKKKEYEFPKFKVRRVKHDQNSKLSGDKNEEAG